MGLDADAFAHEERSEPFLELLIAWGLVRHTAADKSKSPLASHALDMLSDKTREGETIGNHREVPPSKGWFGSFVVCGVLRRARHGSRRYRSLIGRRRGNAYFLYSY